MNLAQAAREIFDDWSPAAKLIGCLAMIAIIWVAVAATRDDDD